jgi:hypothetical protein
MTKPTQPRQILLDGLGRGALPQAGLRRRDRFQSHGRSGDRQLRRRNRDPEVRRPARGPERALSSTVRSNVPSLCCRYPSNNHE